LLFIGPSEDAQQGRELFFDAELGCAGCHGRWNPASTRSFTTSAAKQVADTDVKFDTPSLKFVRGLAPYFHDGSLQDPRELLNANDSEMGHTLQLIGLQSANGAQRLSPSRSDSRALILGSEPKKTPMKIPPKESDEEAIAARGWLVSSRAHGVRGRDRLRSISGLTS